MKHLNKKYFKKKVVDSKDWKDEVFDRDVEDSIMKKKMEARKKAELKLFRIDLMKQLNGVEDD